MQSNDSTLLDVAWAAGFIDGEGCFSLARRIKRGTNRPTYLTCLSCTQVKREPLEKLQRLFGGTIYPMRTKRVNQVDGYQWRVHSYAAHAAAIILQPYLMVKAEQAITLQTFYDEPISRRHGRRGLPIEEVSRRDSIVYRMHELNHRGTGVRQVA